LIATDLANLSLHSLFKSNALSRPLQHFLKS
jgi:hypothetical protein